MDIKTKTGLIVFIVGVIVLIIEELISFLSNGIIDFGFSGLFFIVGIILMFVGRKEFGDKHRKFVVIACIIFLINIIIVVIVYASYFFSIPAIVESIDTTSSNVDLDVFNGALQNIFYIIPIGAFLNGLFFFFMFYQLEDKNGKILLFLGITVSVIVAVYITMVGMQITEQWVEKLEIVVNDYIDNPPLLSIGTPDEIEEALSGYQRDLSKIGLYGIISNIIFLIAMYIPYQRIKNGELQPKLPAHLKRCRYCNRENPVDSVICAYCGQSFNEFHKDDVTFNQNYPKY